MGINALAMLIALFSIGMLFSTVKALRETDSRVGFNQWTMVLHSTFCIVQTLVILLDFLEAVTGTQSMLVTSCVVAIDTLLQFVICYICLTMGSSATLRRFQCTFVKDVGGGLHVKYTLIKEVSVEEIDDDKTSMVASSFMGT